MARVNEQQHSHIVICCARRDEFQRKYNNKTGAAKKFLINCYLCCSMHKNCVIQLCVYKIYYYTYCLTLYVCARKYTQSGLHDCAYLAVVVIAVTTTTAATITITITTIKAKRTCSKSMWLEWRQNTTHTNTHAQYILQRMQNWKLLYLYYMRIFYGRSSTAFTCIAGPFSSSHLKTFS